MLGMARRLAEAGHVVLLPDLFYPYGPYGPFVPAELFKDDVRAVVGPLMATTGPEKAPKTPKGLLDDLGHPARCRRPPA